MKVLVVGGGGREHAIVKKLKESNRITELLCAPGNGGIAADARCINVKATDLDGICELAKDERVDFVVVAPDDPLAMGLVDRLEAIGIRAFGPRADAARLEASKVFSKGFMKKYCIPTARYETFTDADEAVAYIKREGAPIVIKADGLALGKGVIICHDTAEAVEAAEKMMAGAFGESGKSVVIEQYIEGPEVTVLCFADGKTLAPMPSSQDHKRAFDGDKGLNTGGMGAFSPSPNYTPEVEKRCMDEIFIPTLKGLESEGIAFKGVIYFGLMLTKDGPQVIEYNARFGDPEAQAVLSRLESDLLEIFEATVDGTLDKLDIRWRDEPSCCVVLASGGYPEKYKTGIEITGLEQCSGKCKDVWYYHAGTKLADGKYVTSGGRVLGVTALGETLREARDAAYEALKPIHFDGMHYRRDIGGAL